MDIGETEPAIVVEPLEDPFRRDDPTPEPERLAPSVPEREPDLIPA